MNSSALIANPANTQSFGSISCDAGQVLTGGGAFGSSSSTAHNVNASYPVDADTWGVWMNNGSAAASTFRVYALCTTPSTFGPADGLPAAQK